MKHSAVEVAQAWLRHGGNPAKVIEAVAITWAESKWDDSASSFCCHGVWALHQDYYDVNCARNLDCATKEAIKTSKNGTDWSAWDVHPDASGRTKFASNSAAISNYKQGLRIAKRQLGDSKLVGLQDIFPDLGGPGPTLPQVLDDITGQAAKAPGEFGDFFTGFSDTIQGISAFFVGLGELLLTPEGWLRMAKLGGGSIFVLWGLRIIVRNSTGSDPYGTSKKLVKTAAEVAVAKKVAA